FSLIVSAKFTTAWSAPTSIGSATTDAPPAFAVLGAEGKMVYRGLDGAYYVGTYATGWDDATTHAESTTAPPSLGRSAPGLTSVGASLVYGFTTPDNGLSRVMNNGTSWENPTRIAGVTALASSVPAITVMKGGMADLLVVYQGEDLALHSVVRDLSTRTWQT